jgi:chromosome segregation ATPase
VVQLAVSSVRQQNLEPGFLDRPEELVTMADHSQLEKGALSFRMPTRNAAEDKVRMASLLSAIWAESGAGNDAAASHRSQFAAGQKRLEELQQQQVAQTAQLKALQAQLTAAGVAVKDPSFAISENETDDRQRQRELNEAAALVKSRREALADAQTQAARADAGAARELGRVRQNISDLNMRLDAIRLAQSGQSDEAAKRFEAALDSFKQKVEAIPADADQALIAYRSHARDLATEIRASNNQLAERQRQDAQAVSQLRGQIDDRREAHLTKIWAGDTSLQELAEERNAQAHRYATALDSGYADEAQKIKGVLEDIDHKIEARRSALATGAPLSDELQQSLQTAIDRMESDRLAAEQQIAARLKDLAPPAVNSAPAEQQKIADDLKASLGSLTSTRQAYASASSLSASEAQDAARKIETQVTEQQARLDTLRQGSGAPNDPVQMARAALTQAQGAEEKAAAAYASSHALVALLHQYADAWGAVRKLEDTVKSQAEQFKSIEDAVSSTPTVLKPDDSSVKVLTQEDRRVNYLITGIGAVVILFAALMWFSGAPGPAPVAKLARVETLHDADEHGTPHDDPFPDDEHPIVA